MPCLLERYAIWDLWLRTSCSIQSFVQSWACVVSERRLQSTI